MGFWGFGVEGSGFGGLGFRGLGSLGPTGALRVLGWLDRQGPGEPTARVLLAASHLKLEEWKAYTPEPRKPP